MNELINPQIPQNGQNQNTPPKKPVNPYAVIAIFGALALILIVVLAISLNEALEQIKDLEDQQDLITDITIPPTSDTDNPSEEVVRITSTQIKAQLNSVKKLITKEYVYTGAAKQEANKKWLFGWDMPFSDTTLVIMYDGTIIAGVDLSKINPAIDEENRTITILVPKAEILSHDLPQESIRVVDQKESLFNDITLDEYNQFVAAEKPKREQDAIDRGLLTEATDEAKMVIEEFLQIIPGMGGYTLIVK